MKVRQIEIDAQTAELLEARAAARGISISELLADIACNEEVLPADLADMRA
jgi:Ribbon-helix-helix protein, copG family